MMGSLFKDIQGVPPNPKRHRVIPHVPRISDDQVREMRRMYDVDMASASQVHKAFPQFSLTHIIRILDRRARNDVV